MTHFGKINDPIMINVSPTACGSTKPRSLRVGNAKVSTVSDIFRLLGTLLLAEYVSSFNQTMKGFRLKYVHQSGNVGDL